MENYLVRNFKWMQVLLALSVIFFAPFMIDLFSVTGQPMLDIPSWASRGCAVIGGIALGLALFVTKTHSANVLLALLGGASAFAFAAYLAVSPFLPAGLLIVVLLVLLFRPTHRSR